MARRREILVGMTVSSGWAATDARMSLRQVELWADDVNARRAAVPAVPAGRMKGPVERRR